MQWTNILDISTSDASVFTTLQDAQNGPLGGEWPESKHVHVLFGLEENV